MARAGAAIDPAAEKFWPQWRGPYATGVSKTADPPIEWSETKNIRWKVEIPGRGSASPIVWGDKLFVLTAIPAGVERRRLAPAARRHPAARRAPVRRHRARPEHGQGRLAAHRARDAAARGLAPGQRDLGVELGDHRRQRVYAYFDSDGLYAYDMDGKLLWEKDLGDKTMRNEFGEGSTPVLYGNRLVIVWDHQGPSFIAALDALDRQGALAQRSARRSIRWATPLVVEHDGRAQVVTSGMNRVRSYDLETGKIVWESDGRHDESHPVAGCEDGHGVRHERISRQQPEGDPPRRRAGRHQRDAGAIAWSLDHDTPYVPSPLLYDGILYFLKTNSGVLSAYDAKTGKAALSVAAARGRAQRVRVTGRARRAASTSPAATARRS